MTTAARSPAHSCARRISTRGRQHLATANLIVFVTINRFKPADPQNAASKGVQLPVATADTGKLIKAAMMALGALYRAGYRYKKAGVILLDLMPAANVPAGLFDAPDNTKSVAIDALNARFGRGTVAFGTAGERQTWGLRRREFISPRFTTVWNELLRV